MVRYIQPSSARFGFPAPPGRTFVDTKGLKCWVRSTSFPIMTMRVTVRVCYAVSAEMITEFGEAARQPGMQPPWE
jgi:hypothetical protein